MFAHFPRNISQREFPPNAFNRCLWQEEQRWQEINDCGGLAAICPGRKWEDPPWVKMPPQGKRFFKPGSLAYNAVTMPGAGDQLVVSYLVPKGYDGCIVSVVQNYTGQGFQEGSGDITWRIKVNQHYAKDYGNTQVSIGSLETPYNINSGQVLMQALQLIQYFVSFSAAAAGNLIGGRVVVATAGWWWPR